MMRTNQGNQTDLAMVGGRWSCRRPSLDYFLGDEDGEKIL